MKKLSVFLLLVLLLFSLGIHAAAADSAGTLPTGQEWKFDSATGTLTITGTGELPDYSALTSQKPWQSFIEDIKTLTLSEGITSTGKNVLSAMINLTHVELPDSLTTIGRETFSNCIKLEQISIPDNVTILEGGCFMDCKKLASINLPEGLLEIGNAAFARCSQLCSITIPDTVTAIGANAFNFCDKLTAITIPASVKTIGGSAFSYSGIVDYTFLGAPELGAALFLPPSGNYLMIRFCGNAPVFSENCFSDAEAECHYPANNSTWTTAVSQEYAGTVQWFASNDPVHAQHVTPDILKSGTCGPNATWTLQNGLLTITGTGEANRNCWNIYRDEIQTIVVSDSITSIRESIFAGCANLISVKLPDNLTTLPSYLFYHCSKLTTVNIPKNVTVIPLYIFSGCTSLKSIDIPDGVIEIRQNAFLNSGLEKLTLPDSVKSVGVGAFSSCANLKTVTFGVGFERLEDYAFANCTALKTIYMLGNPPSYFINSFRNVNATGYYPEDNRQWHGGGNIGGVDIFPSDTLGKNYCEVHTFGDWTITLHPTEAAKGQKERVCSVCTYKETTSIPKLEPTPSTVPTEPSTVPTEPSTVPTEPSTIPTQPTAQPSAPTSAPATPTKSPVTAPPMPTVAQTQLGTTTNELPANLGSIIGIVLAVLMVVAVIVIVVLKKRK